MKKLHNQFEVVEVKVSSGIETIICPSDNDNIRFDRNQVIDYMKTNKANYNSFDRKSIEWLSQFETIRDFDKEEFRIIYRATAKRDSKNVLIITLEISESKGGFVLEQQSRITQFVAFNDIDFEALKLN